MKSEKAKKYLTKVVTPIVRMYPNAPEMCDLKLGEAKHAVELAEQEAEERMRDELTRWNSPNEPPENTRTVLVKYLASGESTAYYTTGFYSQEKRNVMPVGWMTAVKIISGIIGWREVH